MSLPASLLLVVLGVAAGLAAGARANWTERKAEITGYNIHTHSDAYWRLQRQARLWRFLKRLLIGLAVLVAVWGVLPLLSE